MDITPVLTATRFSQLKPGELFIFPDDTASGVALAATDPARDGDMVMIPLGPGLSREKVARVMDPRQMDVLSFGTDYEVRLPAEPGGWSVDVPPVEKVCFVLSAESLYLRANYDANSARFKACYVDMKDGRILASSKRINSEFLTPRNISGYAAEWSLLTKETEPRVILSYSAQKI
jgi:hypothetical protein